MGPVVSPVGPGNGCSALADGVRILVIDDG